MEDEVEQNLHETVARARFHIKMIKNVTFGAALDLCGRVRTAKCAGDCSESSISHKNAYIKTEGFRGVFGFVWLSSCIKMSTGLQRELDFTLTLLKLTAPEHIWKMQLAWSALSPSCQPHPVSTTSSCQPNIIKELGSVAVRESVDLGLKRLSGFKGSWKNGSFIHALLHSFIHSFVRSFLPSFVRSFV